MRASMSSTSLNRPRRLADHSADWRMLLLSAMAIVVGTGGALGAWLLLKLIAIATNLFWFYRFSFGLQTWLIISPSLVKPLLLRSSAA